MSEMDGKLPQKRGEGGGGGESKRRRRKKRILDDLLRCKARLENGRRCEAAALKNQLYCVFHDPGMQRRRQLMFPIPYEHPDELHRLLAEGVEAVKEKKLGSKEAYALGYLATLLMQNQPRVEEAREKLEQAPFSAELQAAVDRWLVERGELKKKEREEREREEEGRD